MTPTTTGAAQIQRAGHADKTHLAGLLADAFTFADPMAGWLVPEVQQRRDVFIDYFTNVVDHALKVGEVHTTVDRSAVAIWYPHSTRPPLRADIDRYLPERIGGPYAARFLLLDITIADHNPLWIDHRLGWIAVKPRQRHTGLGTALLRHQHDTLDVAGVPTWLMATTSQARDWFQRRGYQLHTPKGRPFALPGGPPLFKMWREPHRSAAGARLTGRDAGLRSAMALPTPATRPGGLAPPRGVVETRLTPTLGSAPGWRAAVLPPPAGGTPPRQTALNREPGSHQAPGTDNRCPGGCAE